MISYRDQYRNCRILGHSELRRLDVPRVYDRGGFSGEGLFGGMVQEVCL